MKQTLKKSMAVILATLILLTAAPLAGFVGIELPDITFFAKAATVINSGTCGDNLTWTLDSDGTLTISGTGDMYDYDCSIISSDYFYGTPWYRNRESIKKVIIESGVTSIGDDAFYCCTSLTSVTIPDSVTSIGDDAFNLCTSLTSVTIPDSVTSIGSYAFCDCISLTSVTIPDSVTSIEEFAFGACISLTSVTIPDSVTSIGFGPFVYCFSLIEIIVDADNKYYAADNGVLYNKDKTTIINYPAGKTDTSFAIPASVTVIGDFAFFGCVSLTSVVIPSGMTHINIGVFADCTSLTSVVIPDSVTKIEECAFEECTSLTDVYYSGTEEEWTAITIGTYNDSLINANIHFNYHPNAEDHDYTTDVTAPTCTAQGYTTYTCICGDTYRDDYVDEKGHAYVGTVTTEPTCTEDGVKTYICSNDATHTYTEPVAKLGHTAGAAVMEDKIEATCTVDGSYNMVVYCAICGEKLSTTAYVLTAPGHTPGAAATCTEDQTCTVCGEVLTEKFSHDYNGVVTAPTCEEDGFTTYTCANCGDTYVADETDALGHNYVGTVTTNPTCTEDGVKTYVCSNDASHTYTDPVDKLGHDWGEWETVTAETCDTDGLAKRACKNDANHVEEKVLPANGHTAGATVMEDKIEATCTVDGSYNMVVYCAICGEKLSTTAYVLTAPGHTPGTDATCTEDQTCTVCGEVLTAKLGHNYKAVITAPTCTEDGYTTYTCVCGDSYVADETAATGHTYDAVVTAPTCTKQGYTTHTCACGDAYKTDYTDATGHDYKAVVTAPTCEKDGYTTYTCANCGDSYKDDYTEMLHHDYADGDRCIHCGEKLDCVHFCHTDVAWLKFIWKILNFLYSLFGTNQYCDCGMAHY